MEELSDAVSDESAFVITDVWVEFDKDILLGDAILPFVLAGVIFNPAFLVIRMSVPYLLHDS